MKNPKVKIFVVCHKPSYVPDNELLYPIQVGTELAETVLPDMLHDNEGENISQKNKSYCELTAQYWAWKNEEADYYGFFHYRRYFSFSDNMHLTEDEWGNIVYRKISKTCIDELHLNKNDMEEFITQYDVIVPKKRKLYWLENGKKGQSTVYNEYIHQPHQHKDDIRMLLNVIRKKYPDFKDDILEYMNGTEAYECNMFIMKKEVFQAYQAWLFDVLFEVEKHIKSVSDYNTEETRVMGFLAERACGIYIHHLKKQKKYKIAEVQKTMFLDTTPEKKLSPVYSDNEIPIVLAVNDGFVPYMMTFIQSVVSNNSSHSNLDFIVLHQNITEANQALVKHEYSNREDISVRFCDVKSYFDAADFYIDQHLSLGLLV